MVSVGIVGASGYTGAELLRLIAQHPDLELVCATGDSQAGGAAAELYPSLAVAYPDLVFERFDADRVAGLDLVFLGLPHEASMALAPSLHGKVGCLVDLSAAFRLKDAALYPRWYGFEHDQPELLADAVYGLPELYRSELKGARLIATPGCYVTAASLALTPLLQQGLIEPAGVIVDAASGVTGAGRGLKHSSLFATVDEDFTAYGLLDHRHTPEIEQVTGAQVLFTPHLAPMSRGILATCYARPAQAVTTDDLLAALSGAGLRRRAVRGRAHRRTLDQGDAGDERRSTSRPGTTTAPARSWCSARSTTSRRGRRAARSSRPTSRSGWPRPRA